MSVLYDDISDGPINSQEYKSFEIYAVSSKISMTEYRHYQSIRHISLWGEMNMIFLVTCLFSLFWRINGAFEVQFFQGFIFTPHQIHW